MFAFLTSQRECLKLTRKNDSIRPFEAGGEVELEYLARKADTGMFVMDSHTKKRPHNLILGRCVDYQHALDSEDATSSSIQRDLGVHSEDKICFPSKKTLSVTAIVDVLQLCVDCRTWHKPMPASTGYHKPPKAVSSVVRRFFDHRLYDVLEVGVEQFRGIQAFGAAAASVQAGNKVNCCSYQGASSIYKVSVAHVPSDYCTGWSVCQLGSWLQR